MVELSDVARSWDTWPVSRKNLNAERIDLTLEGHPEPGMLKAKIEPADPGEERRNRQLPHELMSRCQRSAERRRAALVDARRRIGCASRLVERNSTRE